MKKVFKVCLVLITLMANYAQCQSDSAGVTIEDASSAPDSPGQAFLLKELPRNIVEDQKYVWSFPLDIARGHHWKPAIAFVLATATLVELDPHDTPYFRRTRDFASFNRKFSSRNTGIGEGLFPLAFYLAGLTRSDGYAKDTALLSTVALADSQVVSEVIKNIARRRRPLEIPPDGDFTHTWLRAGGGVLVNRGSFLSGHVTGAFAIATIFAERYRQHRWAPWVAYGLAGLVGASRVTTQHHFPSDVVAGAVLGYSTSRFVVLRHH